MRLFNSVTRFFLVVLLIMLLGLVGCTATRATGQASNDASNGSEAADGVDVTDSAPSADTVNVDGGNSGGDDVVSPITDAVQTPDETVAPSGDSSSVEDTNQGVEDTAVTIPDEGTAADVGVEPDVPSTPEEHCEALSLPQAALKTEGPFGIYRHNTAKPFTFYPLQGDPWVQSDHWTGCDVYLFITDTQPNSDLDPTSIWNRDLDTLVQKSPKNVHYFFVSTKSKNKVMAELEAMQGRIDELLAKLPVQDSAFWKPRLHVAGGHPSNFPGWLKTVFGTAASYYGFAIDRRQEIRLMGKFADVNRYKQELKDGNFWPWENNMSYATHEARQYNYEALRDAKLNAEKDVVIVSPFSGEVLGGTVEGQLTLPETSELATFDTLEIDLTMDCPNPEKGEFGYCGAWDYLVHLYMQDEVDDTQWIEVARFISTYHREGRYLVDATHILPYLKSGGVRNLKYEVSPSWNPQAYLTQMDFRFTNKAKLDRATSTQLLWTGGDFNPSYNDKHAPIEVAIPANAKRVELRAVISGHGMDTNNCAEFCNHQHFFTVNDKEYVKDHKIVGDNMGCVAQIENGTVPNQGGTWWFGRGGWCPGQQVDPWVQDITADVTPGEPATLKYHAKLNGGSPPDKGGNIRLRSYLVVYETVE